MKVLLIDKNLNFALSQEKELTALELNVTGIAPDYVAAMLLLKADLPEFVICSYELSIGNPLINIADYVSSKYPECKIAIYGNEDQKEEILRKGFYFLNQKINKKEVALILEASKNIATAE